LEIIRVYAQSVHHIMDNRLEAMLLVDTGISNCLIKRHSLID